MVKLGNGYGINPCCDQWMPSLADGIPKSKEGINLNGLRRVFELKDLEIDDCYVQKVLSSFNAASANAILQVKLPNSRYEDMLI